MILVDYNQTAISNFMVQIKKSDNSVSNIDLARHMILKSILSYKNKFGKEYGEVVICCDSSNSWRREYFPYYKANRKKDRENSLIDWSNLKSDIDTISKELNEVFPYRVIKIDRAEGDDCIATLINKFARTEPIMICSGDKDFVQLHNKGNVKQYNIVSGNFITTDDSEMFLLQHILRGDSSDGIPNYLSDDNSLILRIRQKPVMTKKILEYKDLSPEEFCNEQQLLNFKRNEILINLDNIPDYIRKNILESFQSQKDKKPNKVLNYLINNKLISLIENVNQLNER